MHSPRNLYVAKAPATLSPSKRRWKRQEDSDLDPFHRPSDAVVSNVTQSDSSSMSHTQRGSVTFISTSTHKKCKPDISAKPSIRSSLPTGQYIFNVHFEDVLHNVTSFFCKVTYRINISIGVTSNAILTVVSILDMDVIPNSIVKDSLLPAWKWPVQSIQAPQLQTGKRELVSV